MRAADSSTASPCSSRARLLAAPVRGARPARGRRRRQVPGGRHHRPPGPHQALHGPRCAPRADEPVERRRQYRLLQHARAAAPRVQEDLQDRLGALPALPRDAGRRDPHRAERLHPVARRPQVGAHSDGGQELWRSAHQYRAQARGVGLAELRRGGDRRHSLLQDRHGSGPQGRAPRPVRLPHEVASRAVVGRGRAHPPRRFIDGAPSKRGTPPSAFCPRGTPAFLGPSRCAC